MSECGEGLGDSSVERVRSLLAAQAAHDGSRHRRADPGGQVLLLVAAPEEQNVALQAGSLTEHGQHGRDTRASGDEQTAPARVDEPEASQGQLHHCLRARVRVLNEPGSSTACPGGDEQTKTILLQPRDRVVTPCVIAHVQTGELPRRPRADTAVQLQLRLPHAGSQTPFGDQGGEVLTLG